MRQRQSLKLDRKTSDATVTTKTLPSAGFGQRIAELKDSVPDIGPVEAKFLTARCDGCGATAGLDFDSPQMPEGWAEHDDGDYCPRCQF